MRYNLVALLVIAVFAVLVFWLDRSESQPPDPLPAQGPPGPPPMGPPPGGGQPFGFRLPTPSLIEALDSNHDGELDAEEITAAAKHLKALDKNNDGQLTEDELGPAVPGFGRGPGGPGPFGGPGGPGRFSPGGPMGGPGGPPDRGRGPGGDGPGGRRGGGPGGPGLGGPGGPGGFRRENVQLVDRFDEDKDGWLNQQERAKARQFLKTQRSAGGGMFGRGPGGPFGGPGGPFGGPGVGETSKPGKRLSPEDVAKYPDAGLYDPHVLRTLFFEFENKDWEEELMDFHNTDVEVPARLLVDAKTYDKVGVRFRGGSSYGVPRGKKRSFNVSVDFVDKKQRVLGYRTLNLLNANTDPSFLRTVLFDHIARNYLPAPQANLVRVVVNGESWGVYINEQQFNNDFTQAWFGETGGARWKVPVNFSGAGGLVYHGDSEADYRSLYELKSKEKKRNWRDLIELCRRLDQTPSDKLEADLDRVFNVDRALWFLAVDNVLMDDDGYFSRGSDYTIYQDLKARRFHLLPYDSNETFRFHGGFGPGGPGGPGPGPAKGESGASLDPLAMAESPVRPVIARLLSKANLRARYLAHVRTIVEEWIDWRILGPIFEDYRQLIAEDVLSDTRNLSSFAEFFDADVAEPSGGGPFGAPPGFKRFVEERRKYLLAHPELAKPRPAILAVDRPQAPRPAQPVSIVAQVGEETPAETVWLYYAVDRGAPFMRIAMKADVGPADEKAGLRRYSATIPGQGEGAEICYYVEARAEKGLGTTTFNPPRTELGAIHYRVSAKPQEKE